MDLYKLHYLRQRDKLTLVVAEEQAEYDRQLAAYGTLPEKHRARAVALLDKLEREIEEARQRPNRWRSS